MLVVVLASNLLLENFVEPKVMGRSLDIHPLVVLVVTALGGLLGGIVGLILAVPAYVIARDAISRFRSRGIVEMVADAPNRPCNACSTRRRPLDEGSQHVTVRPAVRRGQGGSSLFGALSRSVEVVLRDHGISTNHGVEHEAHAAPAEFIHIG